MNDSSAPVRASVGLYRALLAILLPAHFRETFGRDMVDVFAALANAAQTSGGRRATVRALFAELPGLGRLAIHERLAERTTRAHRANPQRKEQMLDSVAQDLRFAGRSLLRAPGFAIIALFTLALGVGANTAIFSVVNGVLLTPLRLREPDRLVALGEATASEPNALASTSPASFYDWHTHLATMRVAGFTFSQGALTGHGEPQQLVGVTAVGGLLEVLGVQPLFGRLLTVADEDPAAPPVIVLSYDVWHRLFGDDRAIVGKTLNLNGTVREIVGVMPPGFTFAGAMPSGFSASSDFWTPAQFAAGFRSNRDQYFIQMIGRLSAGATIEQARVEAATIADRLRRDWPQYNTGLRVGMQSLQESIVGGSRTQLLVLLGAVAFVLLIMCANLGNLLLARATARRREIAIRQALGAGRSRVARQVLTESMLLAVGGGALGLAVGKSFLTLLLAAQATTNLPRANEISLDGHVLVFTLAVSLFAGLLFGSLPAWQLAHGRSADALREGSRGSAGHQWARSALVVSQLALAMVLLTGAGLLLRSFALLERVNPGVRTDHTLTFSVDVRNRNRVFFPTSLERIRTLPGVRSAALVSQLPMTGRGVGAWFTRIDRPLPAGVKPTGIPYRVVTPEYFATVGLSLKSGRLLSTDDRPQAPAIVVNEALVKTYYPGENPIGKEVYLGAPENRLFDHAPIVGVVGDTRDAGLGADALPTAYIPLALMPTWPYFSYVVRTSGDPTTIIAAVRGAIRATDPALPVRNFQTLDDVLAASVAPARWSTTLLGVFAGVALVMAILGVFGVLSFVVTQRTRELGIRIALGATPGSLRRTVVGRGLALVVAGVGLGVAGSMALTRFMGALLFGVTPTDPMTYTAVATTLVIAAGVASYLPARRATHIDPIIALRAE
jgi:putative ABC transport system permease protein